MIDRIQERAVFHRFGGNATKSRSGPLTLIRADIEGTEGVAVAYAIPRSVGSAVVRNRIRRQLRVVMTQLQLEHHLEAGYYLVVVRPGAKGRSMDSLFEWVTAAASGLAGKRVRASAQAAFNSVPSTIKEDCTPQSNLL